MMFSILRVLLHEISCVYVCVCVGMCGLDSSISNTFLKPQLDFECMVWAGVWEESVVGNITVY